MEQPITIEAHLGRYLREFDKLTERVDAAIDAIAAAEGALARAARDYPDVGKCVVRAVIDVERGNLKQSRRHMLSLRTKNTPDSQRGGA